jgi:hypothetical protein
MQTNVFKYYQVGVKDFKEKVWLSMDKKNGKMLWQLWLKEQNLILLMHRLKLQWTI